MGRLAPNHAPQRDQRRISPARGSRFGRDRQLERARHPDHVHPRLRHSLIAEALTRALQEACGDELIVAADEDGHATFSRRARRTLNLGHSQWVSRWPSLSRLTSRQERFSSAGGIATGTGATISGPEPSGASGACRSWWG